MKVWSVRRVACSAAWCVALVVGVASAQSGAWHVEATNGERYALSATDKPRTADQLVRYTPDYYRKNAPNAAGVDVYVVGDKIVEVRDRAQAVYLDRKSDPGAIEAKSGGYVLSGNGAARKWLIANLKVGDTVKIAGGTATSNAAANAGKEVPPGAASPCFPGAYYRKAASSFDAWTGIFGMVKLPEPRVDESRLAADTKQPLDNFSVYMGGRAGEQEIDAGLNWEFTLDESGKRSARRNAFRPFWRNERWNAAPAQKDFYWYPGDVVQMGVIVAGPGRLRLIVADATANPKSTLR